MQKIAIVFPGQGSQAPGMGSGVRADSQAALEVFDRVTEATGVDLVDLCMNSDTEALRQTNNAQIALYTVGVATFAALTGEVPEVESQSTPPPKPVPTFLSSKQGGRIVAMAGHSVGEYAAVACAGMISVEDGAKLVRRRGDLMARSGSLRAGTMAAVLGLEDEKVEAVCGQVSREGHRVVPANFNSPGQVVISGDSAAVEEACEKLKEAGAKRCLPLNVSGGFHSPLMEEASRAMGEALRQIKFTQGSAPVISNVTASHAEPTEWPSLLERQLSSPVRWTQSVSAMREMGVELFVECGPGEVLSGLIKRIDTEASTMAIHDRSGLEALLGQSV